MLNLELVGFGHALLEGPFALFARVQLEWAPGGNDPLQHLDGLCIDKQRRVSLPKSLERMERISDARLTR